MREHMTVPVQWKATDQGFPGEAEGYFSVFGNVDLGDDVSLPGMFKKTLAEWTASNRGAGAQPMPFMADHDLTTDGVIGSVRDARETETGGWFKAAFSGDDKAQSVRRKMIEGHLKGISFTYTPVKHYRGELNGKSVRFLQEVKLHEITVTPFPMNPLALASAKTAFLASPPGMSFAEFREAILAAAGIEYGPASKAALDVLLAAGYVPEIAAAADGTAGNETGPPDGAPGGEPPQALAGTIAALETQRARNQMDRLQAELTEWGNKQ
jgi:HK97 family phage prohead protease